jgi:hypothetical protein
MPASWNSSCLFGDSVGFPATSHLEYIEILHYPDDDGNITSRKYFEGNLDDDSLPRWFDRVLTTEPSFNYVRKLITIMCRTCRFQRLTAIKSNLQVDYVYCKYFRLTES